MGEDDPPAFEARGDAQAARQVIIVVACLGLVLEGFTDEEVRTPGISGV